MQTKPVPMLTLDQVARFWAKVDTSGGVDACHPWTGQRMTRGGGLHTDTPSSPDPLISVHAPGGRQDGYGVVEIAGSRMRAHRVAYTLTCGPIPDGLTIDHVKARGCRLRSCCNVRHLEPVTTQVNTLRGDGPSAIHARKTACVHGHDLTPENTWISKRGYRYCRTCNRHRVAAHKRRHAVA
ncbi:HNH endonuclease [Iamia sp.]|uniref:HNH endonuclease n=1 Tax=Iamia sp. TaxID=2722710 RepID=UPI0039C892F5